MGGRTGMCGSSGLRSSLGLVCMGIALVMTTKVAAFVPTYLAAGPHGVPKGMDSHKASSAMGGPAGPPSWSNSARNPRSPATELLASSGEDAASVLRQSGYRRGFYVRPSKALEQGGGFFVPGLEGSKLTAFASLTVLSLVVLNRVPFGYRVDPHQYVSEAIAVCSAAGLAFSAFQSSLRAAARTALQAEKSGGEGVPNGSDDNDTNGDEDGEPESEIMDIYADYVAWASDALGDFIKDATVLLVDKSGNIIKSSGSLVTDQGRLGAVMQAYSEARDGGEASAGNDEGWLKNVDVVSKDDGEQGGDQWRVQLLNEVRPSTDKRFGVIAVRAVEPPAEDVYSKIAHLVDQRPAFWIMAKEADKTDTLNRELRWFSQITAGASTACEFLEERLAKLTE